MQEIQLKFNAGRGTVDLSHITAVCGDRVGALPKPTRKGYVFEGWYLTPDGSTDGADAMRVSSETVVDAHLYGDTPTDLVLYARWKKPGQGGNGQKKRSSFRAQKKAIVALIIASLLLGVGLGVVSYIVDIYHYEDFDGVEYTIKKKNGEYGLYYKGDRCDVNEDGYYLTDLGTQLEIDKKTGEYKIFAVVDTTGTEVVGVGQRVLMFKQLTYDASSTKDTSKIIKQFEIHNQNGEMILERGTTNRFHVKGYEGIALVDELFAQLSSGCAYTLSMQRLENPERLPDGTVDFAEYGLAPESRPKLDEKGEEVKDKDGNVVMYDYTPTWYTVTTMTDDRYTVTLGDATVSGAGYYARYEGRDTIYILSSANMDAAVLQPVETLLVPMLVYPMTMNNYFNVENFVYRSNIRHDRITHDLVFDLTGYDLDNVTPDENGKYPEEAADKIKEAQEKIKAMDEKEFGKKYDALVEKNSSVVTAFSFVDMDERLNTLYSSQAYRMSSDYMNGYLPHSDNISTVLQTFYSMKFEQTMALGPTDEEMEKYGVDEPAHIFTFIYHDTEGQDFNNYVQISAKTEDGFYYAYSPYFDMIVKIAAADLPFLEWKEIDWYEREYFSCDIAYIQSIVLETPGHSAIRFTLDNSKSNQSEGVNSEKLEVYANGQKIDYTLTVTKPSGTVTTESSTYNFRRFIQSLLTASMEGEAELTEQQMADFRAQDDSQCQLKMTILMDDGKGNTRYLVYRFYQYTERKSYLTVEVLPSPDATPDPTRAQGSFYVLRSFCDKLWTDANRFLNGQEIHPESKN